MYAQMRVWFHVRGQHQDQNGHVNDRSGSGNGNDDGKSIIMTNERNYYNDGEADIDNHNDDHN